MSLSANITHIDGQCHRYEEKYEPNSPADVATCIIALVVISINALLTLIVFIKRKYLPLVAKQPYIIITSFFGSFFFFLPFTFTVFFFFFILTSFFVCYQSFNVNFFFISMNLNSWKYLCLRIFSN